MKKPSTTELLVGQAIVKHKEKTGKSKLSKSEVKSVIKGVIKNIKKKMGKKKK